MKRDQAVRKTGVRVVLALMALACSGAALTAEIELRREGRSEGSIVRLGDVATIRSIDSQEAAALASTELFPAPPTGQQRFVRVRELQDLLLLRGVQLQQHRLTGASQVTIRGAESRAEASQETLSQPVIKKAERQVSEAIVQWLQQASGGPEKWSVAVQLDDAQARLVTKALGNLSAVGGSAPAVGRQTFEVTAGNGLKAERFSVQAEVSLPLSVVVTTHSIPRGAVIGPTDVRLEPGTPGEAKSDSFHAVEEILGSETAQALAEGAVIPKRAVRPPLLVRRGELVTVYARAAGINVRTAARAREDGSQGELVSVESLTDRRGFIARVCGIRELEVFARAPQAESTGAVPVAVR